MPLYKSIAVPAVTEIKIWKITESLSTLSKGVSLQKKHANRLASMKSELHQCGFLSIRHLLHAFGYTDNDLYYDNFGKPHLKDGKQISITHSFHFSAVVISDVPVGIDIEKQRDKIMRIATKFIDYEFEYLQPEDSLYTNQLTVIWCIKEALYKLFATPGLSFLKNTLVLPFQINDLKTIAWIDYSAIKKRYEANFIEFEGFTCAYTLPS